MCVESHLMGGLFRLRVFTLHQYREVKSVHNKYGTKFLSFQFVNLELIPCTVIRTLRSDKHLWEVLPNTIMQEAMCS